MRVISGIWRGRRLAVPEHEGVRPTSDRVREALFDILSHSPDCRVDGETLPVDAVVLDVFAGTGAHGIEALSRGAAHAVFIEKTPAAAAVIRKQLRSLDADDRATILQRDAVVPGTASRAAHLAILDPPYRSGLGSEALKSLAAGGWLRRGALAVVETDAREDVAVPDNFQEVAVRRYGRTKLTFLRWTGPEA